MALRVKGDHKPTEY